MPIAGAWVHDFITVNILSLGLSLYREYTIYINPHILNIQIMQPLQPFLYRDHLLCYSDAHKVKNNTVKNIHIAICTCGESLKAVVL